MLIVPYRGCKAAHFFFLQTGRKNQRNFNRFNIKATKKEVENES